MRSKLYGVVVFLAGCSGVIEDPRSTGVDRAPSDTTAPAGSPPGVDADCDPSGIPAPENRLRRLTHREYRNTVAALFGEGLAAGLRLASAEPTRGFDNDLELLGVNAALVEDYQRSAAGIAAVAAPGWGEPLATCGSDATCVRSVLAELATPIARRPLEAASLERFAAFYIGELGTGRSADGAAGLLLEALLQSPQFLYRLDATEMPDEDGRPIDGWALASRLSYLLWQSMPDDRLFELARTAELLDPATLEAEARRMLEDPRAADMVADFHRQWIETSRLTDPDRALAKDDVTYPEWTAELRASMEEEVGLFARRVYSEGSGTFDELLTSRETYVDAELAALYGVTPPESGWEQRTLPADERAGFLTLPGFLAGRAGPRDPMAVHTGLFVWTDLLCGPPVGDPSALGIDPSLEEPDPDRVMTNRQRWEEDTGRPACAGCHAPINAVGFAFEAYDAIGRYRTTDRGLPVDASGELSGFDVDGPFDGPTELAARLAESERVERCVVRHWYAFAAGRAPDSQDAPAIACLADAFQASGGELRELLLAVVTSAAFRATRAVEEER